MNGFPGTILCAVDGSEASDLAISHVADLIRGRDVAVHVVHVGLLPVWTNPRTLSPPQEIRLRESASDVLKARAEPASG